jgi:hypothetical protein
MPVMSPEAWNWSPWPWPVSSVLPAGLFSMIWRPCIGLRDAEVCVHGLTLHHEGNDPVSDHAAGCLGAAWPAAWPVGARAPGASSGSTQTGVVKDGTPTW